MCDFFLIYFNGFGVESGERRKIDCRLDVEKVVNLKVRGKEWYYVK